MIKLYDNGVYLLNGTEILEEMCIRDRYDSFHIKTSRKNVLVSRLQRK